MTGINAIAIGQQHRRDAIDDQRQRHRQDHGEKRLAPPRHVLVGPIPQHPNDPHEQRTLEHLEVDNDAIERRAPAAEIVQGAENRHVEAGQICHG